MSDRDGMSNNLVQIKASSEEEVQRRIDAFIENKRNEMDQRNIREFISPFSADLNSSCARVEAIYVHREGQKSHITLKNVVNSYGPQTQLLESDGNSQRDVRLPLEVERREAIEERLQNMESHLALQNGTSDVYKRLKALEERIMFLEGLSPEYFSQGIPQPKPVVEMQDDQEEKKSPSLALSQDESLSSINKRIEQLKQILKSKTEKRFSD